MRTRTFILVGVAVFAVLVGGSLYVALSGDGDDRRVGALGTYTAGKLALYSAGSPLGYLKSARCGQVSAAVTRQSGELTKGGVDPKQIGSAQYDSCELTFGLGMEPELYAWINDAMAGKSAAKNLAIQTLNYDLKEQSLLELNQALLTEFSMPDSDAANKDPAYMTITLQPQSMTAKPGSGAASTVKTTSSKLWLPGNFKFAWAGADVAKVTKISGFGFELPPGTQRPQFREFTVTVPESDPGPFEKFLQAFVLEGQNGPAYEKLAKVTFLDSTLSATVGSLTLSGVGAAGGDLVGTLESSSETIAKRRYTLYAEGASLTIGP